MPAQVKFTDPITLQPSDINATVGEQVAFVVAVVDPNKVLNYQWQVSTDEGQTYNDILGENDSTLILTATNDIHNNRYRAIILFRQPELPKVHLEATYVEVNRIYSDGAILSIIGYVYPSSFRYPQILP